MKVKTILFPSEVFDRSQVDTDMKREHDAALDTGLFDVIIFGYDDWFNHYRLRLSVKPQEMTDAVYRGWMMKPEQYEDFYHQLLASNIRLVTTPGMYNALHIFPNVYSFISEDTACIMTFPLHSQIDILEVKKRFPRFMVKDYVKSVKGTEFPAFFDQSITQEEFNKWMEVFYRYRANLLTGGICIKEFLNLRRYEGKTNEYRVYYINNCVGTICRNSLQGAYTPEPSRSLVEHYSNLGSIFYTIDFAEIENGNWKIVEAGDGSVSGLPEGQDYEAFYRALFQLMNC